MTNAGLGMGSPPCRILGGAYEKALRFEEELLLVNGEPATVFRNR